MAACYGLATSMQWLARYTASTASPVYCTANLNSSSTPRTAARIASRANSRCAIAIVAKKGDNNKKSKTIKKADLPMKVCVTCGRPFTWRKKWEDVWDQVKYCSDRCRSNRSFGTSPVPDRSSEQ